MRFLFQLVEFKRGNYKYQSRYSWEQYQVILYSDRQFLLKFNVQSAVSVEFIEANFKGFVLLSLPILY